MSSHDTEPLIERGASSLNAQDFDRSTRASRSSRVSRLTRCLMLVFIAISAMIMMLYSRPPPPINFINNFKTPSSIESNVQEDRTGPVIEFTHDDNVPHWTWICQRNSCERVHVTNSTPVQSLATCNMFCGSPQLWPQPTGGVSLSTTMVAVHTDKLTLAIIKTPSKEVKEHVEDAFRLFKDDLRKLELESYSYNVKQSGVVYEMIVEVSIDKDVDPRLRLNTDESYKISLKPDDTFNTLLASITAQSFCGARNGLETLSQLIWSEPYSGSLLAFQAASVEDSPRFRYRGLLLDTARNFFPVTDIIRTIDAMGANKLNTFHWHATDSQSFPLKLNSVPQLAQNGAYGPAAVYTTEDIKAIVRHATLRGIRVVIEVDAPAHVGSSFEWGPAAGLGDLAYCVESTPWKTYCGEPPCGQLNPKNRNVLTIMEKIYAEIIELTGVSDVFHLGGDEVNGQCWKKNIPNSNPTELWFNFTMEALKALERANGGNAPELTMLWSSGLTQNSYLQRLGKNTFAVQLWGASQWADQRAVLNAGLRSIISHVDAWYFDCGVGSWRDDTYGHCGLYRKWSEVYDHRPWTDRPTNSWRIEGGTACQWTEKLGPEGLDSRLWPRGIAFAERLWSDPSNNVTNDVRLRIDTQRSRMVARGIGADPLWPRWCAQNPSACVS